MCCILIGVIVYSGIVFATLADPAQHRRHRNARVRLEASNLFGDVRNLQWADVRYRVQRLRFKVDALSTYLDQHGTRRPKWDEPTRVGLNLTCAATKRFLSSIHSRNDVPTAWMTQQMEAYRSHCLRCHRSGRATYTSKGASQRVAAAYSREILRSVRSSGPVVHRPNNVKIVAVCLVLNDKADTAERAASQLKRLETASLAIIAVVVVPHEVHLSEIERDGLKQVTGAHGEVVRLLQSPKRNATESWMVNYAMAYAYTIELSSYFVIMQTETAAERVEAALDGVWKLQSTDGNGVVYAMDGRNNVIQLTTTRLHLSRHRAFFPLPARLANALSWTIMLHSSSSFAMGTALFDHDVALEDIKHDPSGCLMLEYLFLSQP